MMRQRASNVMRPGFLGTALPWAIVLLAAAAASAADKTFDAKGRDPNRAYMSELPFEHIDPLTGNVLLTFTDLVLPGNAGFDLRIQRTYNSKIYRDIAQGFEGEDSWAGFGWNLHMGRIVNPLSTSPGPLVEMPDGSRHQLYVHLGGITTRFITADFWTYDRTTVPPRLRLPNGVVYTFAGSPVGILDGDPNPDESALYATRIEDAFGNAVDISYYSGAPFAIDTITQRLLGGQERTVKFTCNLAHTACDIGNTSLRRMRYTVSGATYEWAYNQISAGVISGNFTWLDSVQPPLGNPWTFSYDESPSSDVPWVLTSVTTPAGGRVDYQHARETFLVGSVPVTSPAVQARTVGGTVEPGEGGTWTYGYHSLVASNETTITSPCGPKTVHHFSGISYTQPNAWQVGTLEWKETRDSSNRTWEREELTWQPSPRISDEVQGGAAGTVAPLLEVRRILRPGTGATYTTTHTYNLAAFSATRASNFADYGRPHRTEETGQLTRTVERTFFYFPTNSYPGFANYIVDKVSREQLNPASENFITDYEYETSPFDGFLKGQTVRGIRTEFTRSMVILGNQQVPSGNVASKKDENDHITRYTYQWGVLEDTTTPEGIKIDRAIRPEGLVHSEERRGLTKTFAYDDLFRLTRITLSGSFTPSSNATFIEYDDAGRWVETRRGQSRLTEYNDGFGRPTSTENAVQVKTHVRHDACGRRIYESYPFTGALGSTADIGSSYTLDPLDRVTRRTNPDHSEGNPSFVAYEYGGAAPVANGIDLDIRERVGRPGLTERVTHQDWSAFGHPGDARLVSVTAAVGTADTNTTSYTYNGLGSLRTVTPSAEPAAARSWTYYPAGHADGAHGQLFRETHPENGTVTYTYDPAGNLETRQDAISLTRFRYDKNDRLRHIDRAGTLDDVSIDFDQSDNRTLLASQQASSKFDYDVANRLRRRTDRIRGSTIDFVTDYTPDANDNVATLQYPSGTRVGYLYDNENRVDRVTRTGGVYAQDFEYHPSGGVSAYRAGNGEFHRATYDPDRYWITDIDAGSHLSLDYRDYDRVGNVGRIAGGPGNQAYGYDALDRLRTVTGWGQSSFTYDKLGNRLTSVPASGPPTTYEYDAATQRLTHAITGSVSVPFGYDHNGNTLLDGTGDYQYSTANMMLKATVGGVVTEYQYDGDNLRKSKKGPGGTRYFIHGPGDQILSEFERVGSGPLVATRDYVYAAGRLIASVRPPTLTVTPSALVFAAVAGEPPPPSQTFQVSAGGTSLPWTATQVAGWLTVSPPAGTTQPPATVTVSVNHAGLPLGTHQAVVRVDAPDAMGSPREVLVTLVVTEEPALSAQPPVLSFSMVEGGPSPAPQELHVVYSGAGSVPWNAGTPEDWIDLSAASGTTPSRIEVSVDGSALEAGTHTGFVTVTSTTGTPGSPQVVRVELVIQAPAGGTCEANAWYCEPFDALDDGDLAGQGGWDDPPSGGLSPQVVPDPRGAGKAMLLDPAADGQANSFVGVANQSIQAGFEISMQVMATGVPADTRQVAKIEFFTRPGVAWGKTGRTFGALRFGNTLYLQYGPNIYQVLVAQMDPDRWYQVRVEYGNGRIDAYVDGAHRFSVVNPLQGDEPMQGFGVTGWDFPGSGHIDLIQGRPLSTGLVVEPLSLSFQTSAGGARRKETAAHRAKPRAVDLQRNLPLRFEANRGQADGAVKFLSRGRRNALLLTANEAVLALRAPGASKDGGGIDVVRMRLNGGNPAPEVVGQDELPGKSHYFIGNDPGRWQRGVPHYAKVAYRQVYPGIDLVFHGRQRQLEYDLVVAPGADPGAIGLAFEGAKALRLDAGGDLVLTTPHGEVRQHKPVIYQEVAGARRTVEGGYVLRGGQEVGFAVGEYDEAQSLVIDPVLSYGTFLGSEGTDAGEVVAVDWEQNIYVAGTTDTAILRAAGASQGEVPILSVFVTKLAPDGQSLVYSSYLGGPGGDTTRPTIAVDGDGLLVVGHTTSPAFATVGGVQPAYGGGASDGFLARLDASGAVEYSTYVGGSGDDSCAGVAVRPGQSPGRPWVAGTTTSPSLANLTPHLINRDLPLGSDAVFVTNGLVTTPDADRSVLIYLNGNQADQAAGIAVDHAGFAYVSGTTTSTPHPDPLRNPFPASPGAYQSTVHGDATVFVAKLGPGGRLAYSAYIGGQGADGAHGIAVRPGCLRDCEAFFNGESESPDFERPGFVMSLNATGSEILSSHAIGETDHSFSMGGLAVDDAGGVYVTGFFPLSAAGGCGNPILLGTGFEGAFVLKLNEPCYLVMLLEGHGRGLAVDPTGAVYAVGWTEDPDFPLTPDAFDSTLAGVDSYLVKLTEPIGGSIQLTAAAYAVNEAGGQSLLQLTRTGNTTGPASVEYATSDGTATAGDDYTPVSGTLAFAPGAVSAEVAVPILADATPEANETLTLTLGNPGGGAVIGFPPSALVTILDDDGQARTFHIRDRVLPTGPNWTATVMNAPWLTLSAYSGTGPSTVTANLIGNDVLPGVYQGSIVVTGDTGNSPQIIQVTWTVTE